MHHTPVGPFRYDLIPNDMTFFIMPKCSWAQYLIYHTLWVIQSSKRIHTTEASTNLLPIILPPSFTRSMQELLLQQQMLLPMNHQLLVSQYDTIEIQSNIYPYLSHNPNGKCLSLSMMRCIMYGILKHVY
eukprot:882798_1